MGVGRLVFRMFIGVTAPVPGYRPTPARRCSPGDGTCTLMWRVEGVAAPVPWVPAYAGTPVFAGGATPIWVPACGVE